MTDTTSKKPAGFSNGKFITPRLFLKPKESLDNAYKRFGSAKFEIDTSNSHLNWNKQELHFGPLTDCVDCKRVAKSGIENGNRLAPKSWGMAQSYLKNGKLKKEESEILQKGLVKNGLAEVNKKEKEENE